MLDAITILQKRIKVDPFTPFLVFVFFSLNSVSIFEFVPFPRFKSVLDEFLKLVLSYYSYGAIATKTLLDVETLAVKEVIENNEARKGNPLQQNSFLAS